MPLSVSKNWQGCKVSCVRECAGKDPCDGVDWERELSRPPVMSKCYAEEMMYRDPGESCENWNTKNVVCYLLLFLHTNFREAKLVLWDCEIYELKTLGVRGW